MSKSESVVTRTALLSRTTVLRQISSGLFSSGELDFYYSDKEMQPEFDSERDRVLFVKEMAREEARLRYVDEYNNTMNNMNTSENVQNNGRRMRNSSQVLFLTNLLILENFKPLKK